MSYLLIHHTVACFVVLLGVTVWSFLAYRNLHRKTAYPTVLQWYRILRQHRHWTRRESIKLAFWLSA